MKKLLALLLSAALAVGLALPAAAADAADARLAAVTLAVKETLDLDTDMYDSFYGDLQEGILASTWTLNWSGEDGSLYIAATEDGKILSYSRYEPYASSPRYEGSFTAKFPTGSRESAAAAARTFLDKVLGDIETVELEDNQSAPRLGETSYWFSGTVYLNDIPSPLYLSITVRNDNTITYFNRESAETSYMGGVPAPDSTITAADAAEILRTTLDMRLEYMLDDDGKNATLRYLPESRDDYYVTADGKLVNLTELYKLLQDSLKDVGRTMGGMNAAAAPSPEMAMDAEKQLSAAELTGVAALEGVMDKDALSAHLIAAYPELGLTNYSLTNASYTVSRDEESDVVTARLSYSKQVGQYFYSRTVSADAKDGTLQNVYSSAPWQEDAPRGDLTFADAQTKAEAFLTKYYPDHAGKLALADSYDLMAEKLAYYYDTVHRFNFSQQENGYFYHGNYYNIGIDPVDGSIATLSFRFDDEVTFDSPDGIVSKDAAIDAYLASFEVALAYISVPEAVDPSAPQVQPLRDMGYRYFYTLQPGYQLAKSTVWYIDAKTGEAVSYDTYEPTVITYDDIDGNWAQAQIEKLALYNIGYQGGSFRPEATLTQLDLLALLVSVSGNVYDPADAEVADKIYEYAYYLGLLTKDEREDDKAVTRLDMTRMLLDGAGYGEMAKLSGIFRCDYADADQIPADYLGYAAIAQGLGLSRGDGDGNFAPNRIATRAEAAAMLFQFLSR